MNRTRVPVVEKIMDANDQVALQNLSLLNENGILGINIMASPGAGKTSFILKTIAQLHKLFRFGVIEGDTAPVTIDSDKVAAVGIPAVQINTGGDCHLDSVMVKTGLEQLPLSNLDCIIIENVGNLICPAAFKIGTHYNVLIASTPEGSDKPYKYPGIYRGVDVLIINKVDLLPYLDFDMEYFTQGVAMLNPGLTTFPVSCKTGEGTQDWTYWLTARIQNFSSNTTIF